jgi:hypothetical protein
MAVVGHQKYFPSIINYNKYMLANINMKKSKRKKGLVNPIWLLEAFFKGVWPSATHSRL